jgi:hypothetical protein
MWVGSVDGEEVGDAATDLAIDLAMRIRALVAW